MKKFFVITILFLFLFDCNSKTNHLDSKLNLSNHITFLILGVNNHKKIVFSTLAVLIPNTRKLGFFYINPYLTLDDSSEKVEDLNHKKLILFLEKMINLKVNYFIYIPETTFSRWIDLIGGVEFYFDPVVPRQSEIYRRNLGENLMFGEEILDFLQLKESSEITDSYIDRMNFQQSVLLSVYDRIYRIGELKKEWILFFKELLDTNLTHFELYSLYKYALKGHISISSSEVPGKLFIEEKTKKRSLLVKTESIYYTFEKLLANLGLEDYAYGEIARTEVLNSTGTDGLAKNVKSLLNERNFAVLSVGNGWSQNEKFSVVIDRSGNPDFTYKIAKILNINKIFHLVDKEVGLDTTVILGEDFEFKTRN